MSNTISLILEVDDSGLVKVQNFEKKVVDGNKNIADSSKKTGEAGRLGFFALGNSVEDFARKAGIAGQASRQMGSSVERVAMSALPGLGAALGVAVLAVSAGVAMWQQYTNEQKKAREEMIKATEASIAWANNALQAQAQTIALIAAKNTLWTLEKKINRETLEEGLAVQEKALDDVRRQHAEAVADRDQFINNSSGRSVWYQGQLKSHQEAVEKLRKEFDATTLAIGKTKEALGRIDKGHGPESVVEESNPDWLGQLQDQEFAFKERTTAYLRERDAQISADQAKLDQARNTNAALSEIAHLELQVYDDTTSKMILAAGTRAQAEAIDDSRKIQRKVFGQERITDVEKASAKDRDTIKQWELTRSQSQLNLMSQALAGYVAVTGKNNAALFLAQKAIGIAMIWVDTQRAAMAAYAALAGIPIVGPGLGAAAYAEVQTMGQISMAIAAAASLGQVATGTWSGGGGGGGAGSYDTNPYTGLPTDTSTTMQPQQPVNITNIHVMGDVLDMDQFARKMLPGIKKAEADGV